MSVSQVDFIVDTDELFIWHCIKTKNNLMEKWFLSSKTIFRGVQVPKRQLWINCIYCKELALFA